MISVSRFLSGVSKTLFIVFVFIAVQAISNKSVAQCQAYYNHYVAFDSTGVLSIFLEDSSTTSTGTIINRTWSLNSVTMSAGNDTSLVIPCSTSVPMNVVRLSIATSTGCLSTFDDTIVGCDTGIYLQYFSQDTVQSYCTAPANIGFFVYGNLLGYTLGDTVWMHIDFNDGTDTSLYTISFQNYFYGNFYHSYLNPGTYLPRITVYSPDSLYSSSIVVDQPILISDTCGSITGTVYLDNNQNCLFDSGDQGMANRWVTLQAGSNSWFTYTDSNGVYSFNVPVGPVYNIYLDTTGNWYSGGFNMVCPANGFIPVTSIPSSGNNFFMTCLTGYDLNAQLSGWRFVPGQVGQICVYPFDQLCGSPNGQVHVILDSLLTPLPDASYTISGDTVTWTITSANFYYSSHCISVTTSTGASIGDSVCATVILEPIAGDSVPSNNIQTRCWAVRTSWDPNDKSALPEGDGSNHAIRPLTELTYTIRFQNTGNAPAQNIFILDTIDANLDISTLNILANSHAMIPDVLDGNILRFAFSNIQLPDSNSNEPLSHGYVTYSILPVDPISNGAVINNTAAIYFDYNAPVITNTVFHTIDFFLNAVEINKSAIVSQVFPNPASERIFIRLAEPGKTVISFYDLSGRLVVEKQLDHSGYISVNKLQAGVYKVQVTQNEAIFNTSVVIVR